MKIEACKNVKHGTIKLKAMSNSHKLWEIIFCPSQRTADHDVIDCDGDDDDDFVDIH